MSNEEAAAKKQLVNVFLKTDAGQTKYELPAGPIKVSDLRGGARIVRPDACTSR